jgi:hypothetical protein
MKRKRGRIRIEREGENSAGERSMRERRKRGNI